MTRALAEQKIARLGDGYAIVELPLHDAPHEANGRLEGRV
jgi:hypothetical protein